MKKTVFITLIILVLLISFAAYPQVIERYSVKKINSTITVDGNLDENAWKTAVSTKNFVILGNNDTPAKTTTQAKILWDEDYLYVGFNCQDPNVWATYQDRDDPLYTEDVVEVYIDPDGDGEKYLEVEVNPLNTIFDLWLTKPWASGGQGITEWTMAGLATAISVDGTISNNSDQDNGWICEMALPFSEMKFAAETMNFPPLENEEWRFNMYRFDRSSTSGSIGEATGWSQTLGGQHEPDKFGVIIFDGLNTVNDQSTHMNNIPDNFVLYQNYPNPYNPSTVIRYQLTAATMVRLQVFDVQGRLVTTLVNEYQSAGQRSVKFSDSSLSGGVYLYKLTAAGYSAVRKMLLIR
jgi:hypothetical protein